MGSAYYSLKVTFLICYPGILNQPTTYSAGCTYSSMMEGRLEVGVEGHVDPGVGTSTLLVLLGSNEV